MTRLFAMISSRKRLPAYVLFGALGAFITFVVLMSSPSDPKNAVILGYSLERIFLGLGVLGPGIALLLLTFNLLHNPKRSERLWTVFTKRGTVGDTILFLALAIFLAGWILVFLPPYRLGGLAGYVERSFPVIGWLSITGVVTSVLILIERRGLQFWQLKSNRIILKIASIFLGIFILLILFILLTGLGIHYPADYWYGAGVPILGLQVLFSLFAGGMVLLLEHKLERFDLAKVDMFTFFAIWFFAAWFWAQEPLVANYFMPDTASNVIYPYSDGATFDAGAQYALIGQGIFNGNFFERVLYSIFLTYLHMSFGQDFEVLMTAQAAIFAVLPAVIYLIGRELHGRALGISAGLLIAFRGVNAIIAAKWIDTASPKMALTDFPTAIGISIFILLLVKWLKQPPKTSLLLWAGAVFALTFMVRSNVLTLLPVVLVFIPFALKLNWKQAVLAGLVVLLGLFAVTLPWELRNQTKGIPMYSMYYSRILTVLRHRYNIGVDAYIPSQESPLAKARSALERGRNLKIEDDNLCDSMFCSIANHFFHNTVTSFVSLPTSLVLDDIWNTVKADTPYWKKDWSEGAVGTIGSILIVTNLAVISLGVGSVWSRLRIFTALPIFVFVTYLSTNSLGFTSGGRYIAPVDWIVYLYFMAGGLQLIVWLLKMAGFNVEGESNYLEKKEFFLVKGNKYISILPTMAAILAVGMLLPLSEMFMKPRYQVREASEILAELEKKGLLEDSGYSRDEINMFLSYPDAMIREGRALYPRYYPSSEGEPDRSTYYRYLDYQRLVFTLIGPYSDTVEGVVIPGYPPPISFHAADVVVIGCWNTTYYSPFIDSVVVFSTIDDGYVYNRSPGTPLQCPFAEP